MGKEIKMVPEVDVEETILEEEIVEEYKFLETENLKELNEEELDTLLKEYANKAEELGRTIQDKKYPAAFATEKHLKELRDFVSKNYVWENKSVAIYVAVCDGLKNLTKEGLDENGNAGMSPFLVSQVYNMLLSHSDKGEIEARKYVRLLTDIGGPITEAMKLLADDNETMRNIYTDIQLIEQVLSAKEQGIEINTDSLSEDSTVQFSDEEE